MKLTVAIVMEMRVATTYLKTVDQRYIRMSKMRRLMRSPTMISCKFYRNDLVRNGERSSISFMS